MKNLSDLRARRLIIHMTDTEQAPENFRASRMETPMTPEIRKYVENHLIGTLTTSLTQSARFVNPEEDVPCQLCRRMIDSEQEFLKGSARLAQKYLAVVAAMTRGKEQIARGSLAFVQFEGKENLGELGDRTHRFLAIMKLDLGEAFTSTFEEDTAMTRLEFQPEAVPTKKEGLQKCALITQVRWGDTEHGYDMMMLDRQNKGSGGADFWHKAFLAGKPALDDQQKWRLFNKETGIVLTNMRDHGKITEAEHLTMMEQRYDVLDLSQVDALEWARTRQLSEENKEQLESALAKKLESPVFTPSPQSKEKDFLVYCGDGNLSLKIPQHLQHLLQYEKTPDQAGNIVTRVTFETTKWKAK